MISERHAVTIGRNPLPSPRSSLPSNERAAGQPHRIEQMSPETLSLGEARGIALARRVSIGPDRVDDRARARFAV